jgi:hypothetical protein
MTCSPLLENPYAVNLRVVTVRRDLPSGEASDKPSTLGYRIHFPAGDQCICDRVVNVASCNTIGIAPGEGRTFASCVFPSLMRM